LSRLLQRLAAASAHAVEAARMTHWRISATVPPDE
jgi:hypothetical protein